MSDWIEQILSAWTGHRTFAEWLVNYKKPAVIVELGVDYGYSTFVFGQALKNGGVEGVIHGVDLFEGDPHAGTRNTFDFVHGKIAEHGLGKQINIIKDDFRRLGANWTTPVDVLHIDGFHSYEAVKGDFESWVRHVKDDGIVIFHDTAIPQFGVKDFFRELDAGGKKAQFFHSAGLGIWTRNEKLMNDILMMFANCQKY